MKKIVVSMAVALVVFGSSQANAFTEEEKRALHDCRCKSDVQACERFDAGSLARKTLYGKGYTRDACEPFFTEAPFNKALLINVFHKNYEEMIEIVDGHDLVTEIQEQAEKGEITTRTRIVLDEENNKAYRTVGGLLHQELQRLKK